MGRVMPPPACIGVDPAGSREPEGRPSHIIGVQAIRREPTLGCRRSGSRGEGYDPNEQETAFWCIDIVLNSLLTLPTTPATVAGLPGSPNTAVWGAPEHRGTHD